MKKFLLSLLNLVPWILVVILLLPNKNEKLGADPTITKIDLLKSEQTDYRGSNQKYKHIKEFTDTDGTKYQVDEYVTPKGEVGFQIQAEKPNGSRMSTGTGVEAKDRSYDWTIVHVTTTI